MKPRATGILLVMVILLLAGCSPSDLQSQTSVATDVLLYEIQP